MQAIRHLLAQRQIALLLCAAVLVLKLLVPTGYMIGNDHGRVAITICSGMAPTETMPDMPGMAMAMPDAHGDMAGHDAPKEHGKADHPCAFDGLSAAMTGAIDPVQLAALIAFVMAIGVHGVSLPTLSLPTYLRPPLRGPPFAF